MSELGTRMTAIRDALAALYPQRTVTRRYLDPSLRPTNQLHSGVYTLLSASEGQYTNVPGYSAQQGRHEITLVADIQVDADVNTPEVTEDAEFEMIDEIKTFVRDLPDTLCTLNLMAWSQSGQIDHPRGWVIFQLEYIP